MYTIYGIKNCDTVKKATDWLKGKNIVFEFHDYKTSGISEKKLKEWMKEVSWETLVNKKGTTWKKLDDKTKESIVDEEIAIQLLTKHTSIIKRPVLEKNGKIVAVGFNDSDYIKIIK